MRIIHTSDWHLGHELHGFDRGFEHDAFLGWLLGQLVELKADALIVTGDIYDAVNPPVAAQQRLYRFVKRVLEYIPHFQIVIIGGNHDSAGRLELPKHLLDANRVHLVGGMPREGGRPAVAQTLIKLHDQHAVPRIVCGAVPYIRPGDLPSTSGDNPLAALYREVVETANASAPDLPVIVTGHLYIDGGTASELSERRIVVGGEEMIPAAIFPPSIAYTALGHLHKPQSIPGLPMMRYAGSPIPMSVTERDYEHSIVVVDFRPERAIQTELRPIPRSVAFLRVPHTGAKSLDIIEDELRGLTIADPGEAQRPFLEVAVQLIGPEPDLRQRIDEALRGKPVRLTRIIRESSSSGSPAKRVSGLGSSLDELRPEEVFLERYRLSYHGDPPADLRNAFDQVYAAALAIESEVAA